MSDGPPKRVSPSQATLWADCPHRWYLRHVEKLPDSPPSVNTVVGSFVHDVLEHLLARPADARTVDDARSVAAERWPIFVEEERTWGLLPDEARSPDGILAFKQRAWQILAGAYYRAFDPAKVQAVAREIEILADIDGVPFRGYIDLLEQNDRLAADLTITDYKTGKPPEAGKPWTADNRREKLRQAEWYGNALESTGKNVGWVRLVYITVDDDGRPVTDEIGRPWNPDVSAAAAEDLAGRWNGMQAAVAAGSAATNPGPLCAWCPYVAVCADGTETVIGLWNQPHRSRPGERRVRADAPAIELLALT